MPSLRISLNAKVQKLKEEIKDLKINLKIEKINKNNQGAKQNKNIPSFSSNQDDNNNSDDDLVNYENLALQNQIEILKEKISKKEIEVQKLRNDNSQEVLKKQIQEQKELVCHWIKKYKEENSRYVMRNDQYNALTRNSADKNYDPTKNLSNQISKQENIINNQQNEIVLLKSQINDLKESKKPGNNDLGKLKNDLNNKNKEIIQLKNVKNENNMLKQEVMNLTKNQRTEKED